MPDTRKKFSREPAGQRKNDLIAATLRVITVSGMHAATVRSISEEADVTQGLIRHYFKTKKELISAAYEVGSGWLCCTNQIEGVDSG
jgi:AcrR family transcriptional regulator